MISPISSDFAGAVLVAEGSVDAGLVWHYGDPFSEQRAWAAGRGNVELSNRGVFTIEGEERLAYLHALTTQFLTGLAPHSSALTLSLSPQGFVEHELHLVDDGVKTWVICETSTSEALLNYLLKMRFRMQLEIVDVSTDYRVIAQPDSLPHQDFATYVAPFANAGREIIVPTESVRDLVMQAPTGAWAYNAMRIAAGVPRQDVETDHHTIPLELQWLGIAVHLDKGCYRGQETVSKVARMGKPPRRQTLLHLDGSNDNLPPHLADVTLDGAVVGFVGQSVQHYELGPIASAVIKRSVALDQTLEVDGMRATQEAVVEV